MGIPRRLIQALEWPLVILAILTLPAMVLEAHATTAAWRTAAYVFNWVVWVAFCVEFAARWIVARSLRFLRTAWFDLLLIVLSPPFGVPDYMQGSRSLRALRLVRLLRATALAGIALRTGGRFFGRNKFHYTAVVGLVVVLTGAFGVFVVEAETNKSITSLGDALWWAVVTATTVGYGDVSPVTLEGRLIAVFLMFTGIGVIGVFTATVASYFFEQEQKDVQTLTSRLDAIERKLDALLAAREPEEPKR